MANLERLTARLRTMKGLGSIVHTMKTLSAVMVKQIEVKQAELAKFKHANWMGLSAALQGSNLLAHSALDGNENEAWIIVGAERGFCGQFNKRLVEFATDKVVHHKALTGANMLTAVGTRFSEKLTEQGLKTEMIEALPATPEGLEHLLSTLLDQIDHWRRCGGTKVHIAYTERSATGKLVIATHQIWPTQVETLRSAMETPWPTRQKPLILAKRIDLIGSILRQLLRARLLNACMESMICESSARLSNLQVAEDNINHRLDELTQLHHTQRQAEITAELMDIIAAFDMSAAK